MIVSEKKNYCSPNVYVLISSEMMSRIIDYEKDYNLEPFSAWIGPYFVVVIVKPEDLQVTTFLK